MESNNQTFFDRLQQKQSQLTKKQAKLAFYLKTNYKNAIFMTCSELAGETGMSEATVIRLANALGYDGYTEMMNHIQNYTKSEITLMDKVKSFEQGSGYSSIFSHVVENNLKQIECIPRLLSQQDVDRIVKDLSTYGKTVVMAMEDLGMLADLLVYGLARAGCQVEVLNSYHSDHFKVLNAIDKDTFVIVFDFPRYIDKLVKYVAYAKDKGARVLSIVDDVQAPLYGVADYSIAVPITSSHSLSVESFAALLTIFQIILFEYGYHQHDKAEETLRLHDEFMRRFDV